MVGYLTIQLCIYIPIWLYSYTPMCPTTSTRGGLASVCLAIGFLMQWMLSHASDVRSGWRQCLNAHQCGRAGKFHPHLAFPHAPPHWLYVPPCVAMKVWVRRRRRVGFLFVCLFGASSLCSVFSSGVVQWLFLPFWFAHAGVWVGQWGV